MNAPEDAPPWANAMAEEGFRTTTGTVLSAAHVSRLLKDNRMAHVQVEALSP